MMDVAILNKTFKPFSATYLFLDPLENIRKPLVLWCFQGV